MSTPLRIGLIGLDTSHVARFTELLNHPDHPHHVPGGRVVVGCPSPSPDYDPSASRVDQFTATLRDEHEVTIVDTPPAVAEQADLIFITSVDGRRHLSLLEQVVDAGKPIFIDKPLALSRAEAERIFDLAEANAVPLMSSSALRYAKPLADALHDPEGEPIRAVDIFGPMAHDAVQRGWFWYGIHMVEVAVAALGTGIATTTAIAAEGQDAGTLKWTDGRIACLHGWQPPGPAFGAVLHRDSGSQCLDLSGADRPFYAGLLEAIMQCLPEGRSDVPRAQTLEVIAALESLNSGLYDGATA